MSEDRRAKLAALAARAGRSRNKEEGQSNNETDRNNIQQQQQQQDGSQTKKTNIAFRNYTPKDSSLDPSIEPSSKRIKPNKSKEESTSNPTPSSSSPQSQLEKALLQAKADAALTTNTSHSTENPSLSGTNHFVEVAAPKKVNWDLKRDIAKKLYRLERRTHKAIVELKDQLEGGDDLD